MFRNAFLIPSVLSLLLFSPPAAAAEPVSIAAGPGLSVAFDTATGRITSLSCRGKPFRATGGMRAEDVAAGKAAQLIGPIARSGDSLKWSAEAPDLGLSLEAAFTATDHCATVEGWLKDVTGSDRSVRLTFALNFDAAGWNWWDDMRRKQIVEAEKTYFNGGVHSVYPLCCLDNGRQAVSLAIPLGRYVTHRFIYDGKARELRLEFDFGLSPITKKFPSRADFRFFLFSGDPEWGFRSAVERYYQIVPSTFTTHAKKGGLWMTFHDLEKIPYAEDFHFGFHESGRNPAFNRKLGVTTLHYVIPGQTDVLLPFDAPKTLSLDEVEERVRTDPAYTKQRDRLLERIRIMRDSVMFDAEGQPLVKCFYANWARGKLVYDCHVNSDPDLAVKHAYAAYMDAILEKVDADLEAEGLDLEGVYLDNFGGGIPDYRREHWANVNHPLTFRKVSTMPCTIGGIAEHEYAEHLGRKYWPEGHIVFANGWTRPQLFHTAVLDAGGTETYWATKLTRLGPVFDWDRVLMQGKVHCPLLKFDKAEFNALFSRLEDYLAECTFYGFYPSIYTSGGWKYQSFWVDASMYERYREEFRHYVPVVDQLYQAGWQPLTRATLSDNRLGVERHGNVEDGKFYLTVYNPLDDAVEVTVRGEQSSEGTELVAVDVLHPEVWTALSGEKVSFTTFMRGRQCRVFLICPRATAVQVLWSRASDALNLLIGDEEDSVHEGLRPLADALATLDPDEDPSRLRALALPVHKLAERNTTYHMPGPDRYVTLRARECYRWWSAAMALHRRIHLDEVLPWEERVVSGEMLPSKQGVPGVSETRIQILDIESTGADAGRMPEVPHRRVKAGAFAQFKVNDTVTLPLFVQRAFVTEWPARLSASAEGGAVKLTVANVSGHHLSLRLQGRAPMGFQVEPDDVQFELKRGEEKSFSYQVKGASEHTGSITINWIARDSSGRLVGWANHAVMNVPAKKNMLAKSGFEDWQAPPPNAVLSGSATVIATDAHTGKACLFVEAQDPNEAHSCQWNIPVAGPPPEQVIVSGWSRAENVSGERNKEYSIWVGARTKEGGWAHIGTVQFATGTHDWEHGMAAFPVPRNVVQLNVWALFRSHSGKAWFDDVFVAPADAPEGYNLALAAEPFVNDAPSPAARVVNDGHCDADSPAYCTDDNRSGHSLELRWKTPIEVSRALLHWPMGENRPLSSTEYAIQFYDGRDWAYWALGHTYVPEQISILTAPPVVINRLRLIQAPGGGSIDERQRLQLTEIEVF